ncbi:hypothetical protein P4S63_26250 [Pseudoalteromonas sp. B193]
MPKVTIRVREKGECFVPIRWNSASASSQQNSKWVASIDVDLYLVRLSANTVIAVNTVKSTPLYLQYCSSCLLKTNLLPSKCDFGSRS